MEFPCFDGISKIIHKIFGIDDDDDDDDDENDMAFWSMDGAYGTGYLSYATIKGRPQTQDFSHIHIGPGTFFGVYDGHHGTQAAEFVSRNILDRIIELALQRDELSEDIIRDAITEVDKQFVDMATDQRLPSSIGTCCTVGLIWGNKLCVGDIGDSVIVSGRFGGSLLTEVKSRSIPRGIMPVREEPLDPRPEKQFDDPRVFLHDGKAWRAGGSMPVWKCIGDGYVKLEHPTDRVHVATYTLSTDDDKFLICASHGLWEHLSVPEAIEIVQTSMRKGIARKLAREAMKNAVSDVRCMRYMDLKHLDLEERQAYHDDITVIVLFLDKVKDVVDGSCSSSRMVEPFIRLDEPSEFHRLSRTRLGRREGKEVTEYGGSGGGVTGIYYGAGPSRGKEKGKGKRKAHHQT